MKKIEVRLTPDQALRALKQLAKRWPEKAVLIHSSGSPHISMKIEPDDGDLDISEWEHVGNTGIPGNSCA